MGRRSKRSKSKSSNIVRIPFQAYITTTMSSGALQLALHPSNFSNLTNIALVYELYKFTRLEYALQPRTSANSNVLSVAYYPDATVTSVGHAANMESLDGIVIQPAGNQVAPVHHRVPPTRLKGQLQWYKCVADASASEFENQGVLLFAGSTTEAVNTIVKGTCEFKNPMDSAAAISAFKDRVRMEVMSELRQLAPIASSGQAKLAEKQRLPITGM